MADSNPLSDVRGIDRLDDHRFMVDVARWHEGALPWWSLRRWLPGPSPVLDAHLLGRALAALVTACGHRDLDGRPLSWTRYVVHLNVLDHKRLQVSARLGEALARLLEAKAEKLGRVVPSPARVVLVAHEASRVPPGQLLVHVDVVARGDAADPQGTVRPGRRPGEATVRVPEVELTTPRRDGTVDLELRAGERLVARLVAGRAYVLGRGVDGPGYLGVPEADLRVSREALRVEGIGRLVRLVRVPGSNPVVVDGATLPEGSPVVRPLPCDVHLVGAPRLSIRSAG